MYHWSQFPAYEQLKKAADSEFSQLPLTNAHLHTPFSFSAFSSVEQAVQLAKDQGIKVIGINDFNTVAGYAEWSDECYRQRIAPLFNIEMIGLNASDQQKRIRVNDPSNPGRTYLSGKGLRTYNIPAHVIAFLENAVEKNNDQSAEMTRLLNKHLEQIGAPFQLDFEGDIKGIARGQIRERHLATALRQKMDEHFGNPEQKAAFFRRLTHQEMLETHEAATIENQLRSALLKSGGPAFVPEDATHFSGLDTIRNLIIEAGGVPTYPFLGDALSGECTDFEADLSFAMSKLKERGVYSVEFITPRNSVAYLQKVVPVLWENGFLVTFGTEHNTPAMTPMVPLARGGEEIPSDLLQINVNSVCILMAHQYMTGKYGKGWLDQTGKPRTTEKDVLTRMGRELINAILFQ